jgi:signal transduction histidine kinase
VTALVDNAVRHATSAVEVSVRPGARTVVLEVRDDGPGVDPELAPRLFSRFVSTHQDGPDGRRHYGLGLALVSEIVVNHGGSVELTAAGATGTVFRLTLPRTSATHG